MTAENNESLIGYDPLAWINNNDDDNEEETVKEQEIPTSFLKEDVDVVQPIIEKQVIIKEDDELTSLEVNAIENDLGIILNSNLNIRDVAELHNQLLTAFQKNQVLDIDASAVESIDTANLQLLVILKQEALKLDKNIIFDFPSDKFIESASQIGVCELLGLDQAASGFF